MIQSVLVTGGAGFIGSHVVERLLDLGKDVTVFDYKIPGRLRFIDDAKKGRLKYFQGDIRAGALRDGPMSLEDVDAVIHMAALVNVDDSNAYPAKHFEVNFLGTVGILQAVRAAPNVQKLVYVSTAEVYGYVPEPHKASEGSITEVNPSSPYAASKYAAERTCMAWYDTFKRPETVAVRPFNCFGPRQTPGGLGALHAIFIAEALRGRPLTIFGSGEQSRDYIYVTDLARGIVSVTLKMGLGRQVINLASGQTVSVNTVAEKIRALVNPDVEIKHGPERPNENMRSCGDASKAGKLFGWMPRVSYDEGLKMTVEWYRHHVNELDRD